MSILLRVVRLGGATQTADEGRTDEVHAANPPGEHPAPPEKARTVRVRNGKTPATDGPFAETKEALGGYLLYEADDFDAAVELASQIPAASMGGAVEMRPLGAS
jgi:hypothetical protein